MPTILFQPIDTVGIGHISRLASIGVALRQLSPAVEQLFVVTGNEHGILSGLDLPSVSIPEFQDQVTAAWESWNSERRQSLSASLAEAIVSDTKPDLIVFDTYPSYAILLAARRRRIPYAIVLRKKSGDTTFTRDERLLQQAKLILVPHTQDELSPPLSLAAKTHFVGTIIRPSSRWGLRAGQATVNVLITAGGGGYPGVESFLNEALAAFASCQQKNPSLSGLAVTGPVFLRPDRLVSSTNIPIVPFIPDLSQWFPAVDVVVCQGGYNTIAELAASGARAVCVPAERFLDDQFERANAATRRHPQIRVCASGQRDEIAALMEQVMTMPHSPVEKTHREDGAKVAAQELLRAISG